MGQGLCKQYRFRMNARGGRCIFNKQEIGRRGEEIAAAFLERRGFVIVERNYHCRWGELDIIAVNLQEDDRESQLCERSESGEAWQAGQQRGIVHFVEVKTRTGALYGTPGEAVTYAKQQKLKKTALRWLQAQERCFPALSFDVIEVWVTGGTAGIRWLQNCF